MTTLFGNTAIPAVPQVEAPAVPKKRGWLPLLTVLFLISYGLMTMLIVEQGQTIESQRALIRELFRDSTELSAMKMRAQATNVADGQHRTQAPSAKTQNPSSQNPSTQNPSTQYPSTQIPSTQAPTRQAPSSQAVPQRRTQNQTEKQKPQFQMPSKAPSDLVDDRRALITI
jgi:hypothetical protein